MDVGVHDFLGRPQVGGLLQGEARPSTNLWHLRNSNTSVWTGTG
jgi:hypothetical protein